MHKCRKLRFKREFCCNSTFGLIAPALLAIKLAGILAFDPTIAEGRRLGEILSDASDSEEAALSKQTLAQRELIDQQREALAAKRVSLLDQQKRFVGDAALQRERVKLAEQSAVAARTLWSQKLMSALQ